jgi:DNA repair exonuclease SbcCD ATPase subunit
MFVSMTVENFRGVSRTYEFSKRVVLKGANGARKSTIKEAVAFAITGCDASGNRAPVHLISWGEDGCRVSLQTQRSTIVRTLSSKKNSTIKLERIGLAPSTLTQSQFEVMLGSSTDLFLSVFSPGYFWTLAVAKQQAVLAEVTPKFDNEEFIEGYMKQKLTEADRHRYRFTEKRPDTVALVVAGDRRDLQRQIDVNLGRLAQLSTSAVLASTAEPLAPEAETVLLAQIEELKTRWVKYRAEVSSYNRMKESYDASLQVNVNREARRAELEARLTTESFELAPLVAFAKEKQERLAELRKSFQSNPQRPKLVGEVDSPTCPTCGQVVGLKHKEKVRAENLLREEEYQKALLATADFNRSVQDEINTLLKEEEAHRVWIRKIEEDNAQTKRRKGQIEGELAGLSEVPLPVLPALPEQPTDDYSAEREKELRRVVEHYNARLAEHRFAQKAILEQETARANIERDNVPLSLSRDRLALMEEALKALPAARLDYQATSFVIPGFTFLQGDETGISLVRNIDQCPLQAMSTGQTINVNILFSQCLNRLMRRPIGSMFIDNADLVDRLVPELYECQAFEAYVVDGQQELILENAKV